ncbi:MAG: hypothetical protein PHD97_02500 [Bacteroidales bacterium]|nr:hypothetical protein [Bacteroidales bacterium]
MRKNIKYKHVLITAFILGISFVIKAQPSEKHKYISNAYKAFPETSVQIANKYGNINVITWEKDSVLIEVDIKAIAKPDKVEKILNNINVNFTNSQYYIIAKLIFNDFKGTVLADFSDMATTTISGGNKVEVNWTIHIPEKTSIALENKFGSIYTTNHSGKLDITLSNGDLKANNLLGETKLNLEFGNCSINNMKNAKLVLNYSEFNLVSANKLNIESKSSKIEIKKVNELEINSKRDKYYIDTVDVINSGADFSYLNISQLNKSIFSKSKYGSLKIDNIENGFKYINLLPTYSDINLSFNKESSFTFSLTTKKTSISMPEIFNSLEKTIINKEDEAYKVAGIIGQSGQSLSEVQINAVSGSVVVKFK